MTSFIAHHGYLAIFVLMAVESACIPIPSEVIMLFGGALAGGLLAHGGHPVVGLAGVGIFGALGNLVGSWIAYAVGRIGGRPLLDRWGRYIMIRQHELDRSEVFFRRWGAPAVLIGRVLPVVRTFISLPAGVAEMPLGRFSLYTLLGSLPWTFGLAAAGDALASNWRSVSNDFTPFSIVIGLIAVAVIAVWYYRARKRRAAGQDVTGTPSRLGV